MAKCAASDATPLWECVNGDYDTGRVGAALQVLYRIGIETSCSVCHLDEKELAVYEARRAAWPSDRDQLPITPGKLDLPDEQARAICRSFKPTLADIRRALDWALAVPKPDKIPYLLILQTENFAFSKWFSERMLAALTACAAADLTPLLRTISEDYEPYRIWAATKALLAVAPPEIVAKLLVLPRNTIGWMAFDEIKKAATQRSMCIPDEAQVLRDGDRAIHPHLDPEDRKQTWPKEFDRLPREPRRHNKGRRRLEASYSTDSTQLTVSLERIRVWGEAHDLDIALNLNRGLGQAQIIELASQLPRPLPAEICELYRWRNGSSSLSSLDTWRPFRPLAEVVENYHELTELARDQPDIWEPEWLALFDEGKSRAIVMLPESASPIAPIYGFYSEDGIESTPAFPSLTVMMAVHAEAYEELAEVTGDDWFDASYAAVERARQRRGLLSPDR